MSGVDPEPGEPDLDALMERYLDALEAGERPPVHELLDAAGPRRNELAQLIELHASLAGIGRRSGPALPSGEALEAVEHFELLEELASGGSGTVYRARDTTLGREVAVKLLGGRYLTASERALVLNEARSMARLEHRGVCRVHEVGTSKQGRDYVAMELLAGPSLAELIELLRRRSTGEGDVPEDRVDLVRRFASLRERVRLLVDLARALDYCHDRGVIHRDVKPQNVLLTAKGRPKLIDFGNAHHDDPREEERELGLTERFTGTDGYMAPEQIDAERVGCDPKSDQFSLGIVAYELLSLRYAVQGETRTARLNAASLASFDRLCSIEPTVTPELEAVVHHALERDPSDRYPTLAGFANDLENVLEDRPITIEPPSLGRLLRLWAARNVQVIVRSAFFVLGLVVLAFGGWLYRAGAARASIDERVTAIDASDADTFIDLREEAYRLIDMKGEAKALEGSLADALLGSPTERVREGGATWSRRVNRAYEDARARTTQYFQEEPWLRLVDLEELLCPECPYNMGLRRRGALTLETPPSGVSWDLLHEVPYGPRLASAIDVFRSTGMPFLPFPELNRLNPGTYRLEFTDPSGAVGVREFFVFGPSDEHQLLELRFPDADLLASASTVPDLLLNFDLSTVTGFEGEENLPVLVDGFLVSDLVRFSDVVPRPGFAESGLSCEHFFQSPGFFFSEGLAFPSLAGARELAAAVGGRLPTALELLAARAAGAIEFDRRHALAEWVSDTRDGRATFFNYSDFEEHGARLPFAYLGDPPNGNVRGVADADNQVLGIPFRVVFPVPLSGTR